MDSRLRGNDKVSFACFSEWRSIHVYTHRKV